MYSRREALATMGVCFTSGCLRLTTSEGGGVEGSATDAPAARSTAETTPDSVGDLQLDWRWSGSVTDAANVQREIGEQIFFASGESGEVVGVDAETGEVRWRNSSGDGATHGNALEQAPEGDELISVDVSGVARLLDAETGEPIWTREVAYTGFTYAEFDETTVYLGTDSGGADTELLAVGRDSGDVRWRRTQEDFRETNGARAVSLRSLSGPVDGELFVGTDDGSFGVSTSGGTITDLPLRLAAGMTRDGDRVFVPTDQSVEARRLSDFEELWSIDTENSVRTPPVVAGEHVYVSVDQDGYYALDRASGEESWSFQFEAPEDAHSPPSVGVTFDYVWFGDTEGIVHAVDPQTGETELTYRIGSPSLPRAIEAVDESIFVLSWGTLRKLRIVE